MKRETESSCLQLGPLKVLARVADVLDGVEAREALHDRDEVAEALQRGRRAARLQNEPSGERRRLIWDTKNAGIARFQQMTNQ